MIELINVSKYYVTDFGRHYVFSNVSLVLPLDKSVAIVGPNGAGKSTFLRLISGADMPSEGKIIRTGRISPPMGLTPGLQSSLTACENTRFAGRIYGMTRDEIDDTIDYVRELSDIGKYFDLPIGTYSAGMKQRVAFAINMSLSFDYYLFDEISAGGDREFRKTTTAMVKERLKTSKFIIASHRSDELLEFCDAGIVIKDGELNYYDDIKDALEAYGVDDDDESPKARRRRDKKPRGKRKSKLEPENEIQGTLAADKAMASAEQDGIGQVTAPVRKSKAEREAKRRKRKARDREAPPQEQDAEANPIPRRRAAAERVEDAETSASTEDDARELKRARKRRERIEQRELAAKTAAAEEDNAAEADNAATLPDGELTAPVKDGKTGHDQIQDTEPNPDGATTTDAADDEDSNLKLAGTARLERMARRMKRQAKKSKLADPAGNPEEDAPSATVLSGEEKILRLRQVCDHQEWAQIKAARAHRLLLQLLDEPGTNGTAKQSDARIIIIAAAQDRAAAGAAQARAFFEDEASKPEREEISPLPQADVSRRRTKVAVGRKQRTDRPSPARRRGSNHN